MGTIYIDRNFLQKLFSQKFGTVNFYDFNSREYIAYVFLRPNLCGFYFCDIHGNESIVKINFSKDSSCDVLRAPTFTVGIHVLSC